MGEAEKALFAKSVDSVKGLVDGIPLQNRFHPRRLYRLT